MICDRCYQPLDQGAHGLYVCPLEPRRVQVAALRQDTIEGGVLIHHGLCNLDGTPRRYDSRSEIARECQVRNLMPWSEAYTEDRTKDARVHADWLQSGEAQRAKRDRDDVRREKRARR